MGNPNRLPQDQDETFEGKLHDPRLETNKDPRTDPRFDTHLNPASVAPRLSVTTVILGIALGLLIFALVIAVMYWKFQTPAPRSPEPESRVRPVAVADAAYSAPVLAAVRFKAVI